MINIFIGYDRNEQIAYHVLSQSILRNATRPVRITPLYQPNIKYEFSRERSEIESTEFSFIEVSILVFLLDSSVCMSVIFSSLCISFT